MAIANVRISLYFGAFRVFLFAVMGVPVCSQMDETLIKLDNGCDVSYNLQLSVRHVFVYAELDFNISMAE